MTLHTCTECGLTHDHGGEFTPPVSDAVRIAEIEANRDVKVAQLQAREERDYNETRVEVAEIEAGAEVAAAEVTAEVVGELIAAEGQAEIEQAEGGEPEVIITEAPPEEPVPDVAPPPESSPSPEPSAKKSMWPYG